MKKSIIISGIDGFLGNGLKDLLKDKFQLFGIGRQDSYNEGIKVYSSENLNEINFQPNFLILCHAAISSGDTMLENDLLFKVNVSLTERILTKFKKAKIIFLSTASIYDTSSEMISEDTIDKPLNGYSLSKYWAEQIILASNRGVILRLSSLYGENMKENTIIPNYTNQALKSGAIEVWGKGQRYQNYIHIDDVCDLVKKILSNHKKHINEVLLGVHYKEYSNLELARIIAANTESQIKFVKTDISNSFLYNNEKTQASLNWTPKAEFFTEISNYIKWKKKQS